MKMRISGRPGEVAAAVDLIREMFDVLTVSAAYPLRNQSREVRVYVDMRLRGAR